MRRLALTGLHDDYIHQGRPIGQVMTETRQGLNRLADIYLNADAQIAAWTTQRNDLAAKMIALLHTTAPGYTNHHDRNLNNLIRQDEQLLAEVHAAAA